MAAAIAPTGDVAVDERTPRSRMPPKKQGSVEYLASLLSGGLRGSRVGTATVTSATSPKGVRDRKPPPKRNSSVERLGQLFQKSLKFGRRPTPTDLSVPEFGQLQDGIDARGETPWNEFEGRYSIVSNELLGQGSFSEVRPVVDNETGLTWACKIATGPEETGHLLREARLLERLDHPNIIKCREYCRGPEGFYMITELLHGKDLFSSVTERGSYCEEDAREVMTQLLDAVAYLSTRGIAHRDLKLQNIMLVTEGDHVTIKLIDFGLSGQLTNEKVHFTTTCGTPHFSAPEVLRKNARYGTSCDVWSCGVVLYVLLAGEVPFQAKNVTDLIMAIREGPVSFKDSPAMELITPAAQGMIRMLMERDALERVTAKVAIQHEWITAGL